MTTETSKRYEELAALDKKHYLHPSTAIRLHQDQGPTFVFTEGKGIYLTDVRGDRYIDGVSSLWNVNIGHGREEIGEVAKAQMGKLAYSSSFAGMSHETVIQLAHKISTLTPGDLNVSFFTSGGSESNDTAFKLVRYYWKLKGQPERTKIIAHERGYHGITIGATSATGLTNFQNMSTAKAPDFLHAKGAWNTEAELGDRTQPGFADSFRGIIEREGPETVAAIIVEPVQGSGGVVIPPPGFMQALRKLCDEYGILMIADEVICGFGRSGKWFGVNNWDVVPDLMTVAKGITSGYMQLGAVILREGLRDELADLSDSLLFHGFTYSGHPTACAVALRNLEILESEALLDNVNEMNNHLQAGLEYLAGKHRHVGRVRSIGLMGAFEMFRDPDELVLFDESLEVAQKVVRACFARKLIVRPIIFQGTQNIAMAPPFIINRQQVEEMIAILSDAIAEVEKSLG
jgi:putrescine aminotransferase